MGQRGRVDEKPVSVLSGHGALKIPKSVRAIKISPQPRGNLILVPGQVG